MDRQCQLFCLVVFLSVCGITHLWQTRRALELFPKTQNQGHLSAPVEEDFINYHDHLPKKNITVLLAYYPASWFEEKSAEERAMIMTNRQCYSAMHNYTFLVGSDIEVSHGYWAKLVHTHRLFNSSRAHPVDWVFFADADFFITNFNRRLESYIPTDDDYHVIVPQDAPGRRDFSNFNFLVKNSDVGRRFINIWLEEMQACNPKWPDQVAMWRSILRLLDPYRGTDCEQAPDQCCRTICNDNQSDCFQAHINAMGCGPTRSCPPVHFSDPHTGLGLATKVDTPWDFKRLYQPLGIHCKPHYKTCQAYQTFFRQEPGGQCSIFRKE